MLNKMQTKKFHLRKKRLRELRHKISDRFDEFIRGSNGKGTERMKKLPILFGAMLIVLFLSGCVTNQAAVQAAALQSMRMQPVYQQQMLSAALRPVLQPRVSASCYMAGTQLNCAAY